MPARAAGQATLAALSPVMLLPTIMTIICLDTCQAFSAPTCPTSSLCPLIARSLLAHTFASFVHTSTLASGPADAAAEECQTLRSHILRAEECQALRPLSSATGLGHRRGAPRHYITSGPRRVLHGLAAPDWRGDHECRARVVVHKDREWTSTGSRLAICGTQITAPPAYASDR